MQIHALWLTRHRACAREQCECPFKVERPRTELRLRRFKSQIYRMSPKSNGERQETWPAVNVLPIYCAEVKHPTVCDQLRMVVQVEWCDGDAHARVIPSPVARSCSYNPLGATSCRIFVFQLMCSNCRVPYRYRSSSSFSALSAFST